MSKLLEQKAVMLATVIWGWFINNGFTLKSVRVR
jgi:hypothetical protein